MFNVFVHCPPFYNFAANQATIPDVNVMQDCESKSLLLFTHLRVPPVNLHHLTLISRLFLKLYFYLKFVGAWQCI